LVSLHAKNKAYNRNGTPAETAKAPIGPQNSYVVVRGFNDDVDFAIDMMVRSKENVLLVPSCEMRGRTGVEAAGRWLRRRDHLMAGQLCVIRIHCLLRP